MIWNYLSHISHKIYDVFVYAFFVSFFQQMGRMFQGLRNVAWTSSKFLSGFLFHKMDSSGNVLSSAFSSSKFWLELLWPTFVRFHNQLFDWGNHPFLEVLNCEYWDCCFLKSLAIVWVKMVSYPHCALQSQPENIVSLKKSTMLNQR